MDNVFHFEPMDSRTTDEILNQEIDLPKVISQRTVDDFINDALARGRSLKSILAVASATHWQGDKERIKEIVLCKNK